MKIIDARGKSCPQPVIMTRKVIEEGTDTLKVIVDNQVASSNVKRLLEKMEYSVSISEIDEGISISGVRTGQATTADTEMVTGETDSIMDTTIFISRDIMGGNDRELGEILIKGFLGTIVQMPSLPRYIALMNEGVKLALKGTSTCEYLRELEEKGCEILVCGTCTNHFGITEQVGTGIISNMFDITESFLKVNKVISI